MGGELRQTGNVCRDRDIVAGMVLGIGPLLHRCANVFLRDDATQYQGLTLALLVALSSACIGEMPGIQLLFGGFLAGVVMPNDPSLLRKLRQQLEPLAEPLFLPVFLAFTGLRTNIAQPRGPAMWSILAWIIAAAVAGKVGGSTITARCAGIPWREALSIGALLYTRDLMELVILNIALGLHVIRPALFTMMVLMAMVTTYMTSPLLNWLRPPFLVPLERSGIQKQAG
jgi:Kef-type K+ transport system membrane component KefB